MYIPKGNVLIEDIALSYDDMREMQANLAADSFTGYLKLDLESFQAYIFYVEGELEQILEVENATGAVSLQLEQRLLNHIRINEIRCSTYVTSKRVAGVLTGIFAFQPLYVDYEARKRDMPRVLEKLQDGRYSGIIKFVTPEGMNYILVDNGEVVRDRFCSHYGDILSGSEAIDRLLNFEFGGTGATVSVLAERSEEIDSKRRAKEEVLEKIKTFVVKTDGGFLRANDVVRVDNYIVREWNIADVKSTFPVEIETQDGSLYEYKCQAGAKFADRAGLTPAMMKKMGLVEGDTISIRPLN